MSELGPRWLVLSPHCDDGVLSLGGSLARHVRGGGSATIVTMLAGSIDSTAPTGSWDAAAGFDTEGATARARRAEDLAACRALGVRAVHLDGVDEQYGPSPREPELWDDVRALAADHDVVFLPGSPLVHADHRRLASDAARELAPDTVVRVYGEEPYLLLSRRSPLEVAAPAPDAASWSRHPVTRLDAARKLRAVRCYRSQLRLLAGPVGADRLRTSPTRFLARLYVRTRRGEWLGVPR